jgi:hypothetical protein
MPQFLSNINLNKSELQNAVVHPLGTAPANPKDGQIYYNSTDGIKTLFIYDDQIADWKSIAGNITSLVSNTTGQLVISNPTGPTPTFEIVTAPVTNGSSGLVTGDQVYDYVTNIADGKITSFEISANTGTTQTIVDGTEIKTKGGDGIDTQVALNGSTVEVTVSQSDVSRSNTSSADAPINGGSFQAVDSITTDAKGNVTEVNVKTVTLPSQTDGTVKSVDITPGALIDKAGGPITDTGSIQIDVDLNELTTTSSKTDADFIPVINAAGDQKKIDPANIPFTNLGAADSNIDANTNRIVNLTDPVDEQDAATKHYVDTTILGSGALQYQGGYNADSNAPNLDSTPTITIKAGFTWTVVNPGLFFTENVHTGDVLIAEIDNPLLLQDWTLVQANIHLATTSTPGIASFNADNFTVNSAGRVTLKESGVVLGTDTDGDYVEGITTGAGLDGTGSGEGSNPNISLNLDELTEATLTDTSFVAGVDGSGNTKKFKLSDLADLDGVEFEIVGNNSSDVFTSVHSLGFKVSVQVYDNNPSSSRYGETVFVDTKRVVTGTQFSFNTAPATGQNYYAVIKQIA